MRVLEVQLRDFRTYARAQASLGEFLTVVHGPNGAGKSNLLEALYFGCTGRSLGQCHRKFGGDGFWLRRHRKDRRPTLLEPGDRGARRARALGHR